MIIVVMNKIKQPNKNNINKNVLKRKKLLKLIMTQ